MSYEIVIKDVKPQRIVSIRTRCQAAEIGGVLMQLIPEVYQYLVRKGIQPAGPPFTRYHSYSREGVDLEGGIPVADEVDGDSRIVCSELPGGAVATTVHVGPYEKLPEAHDALHVWMREQQRETNGAQWEYYWTDPGTEPDPAKWKTELVWPIR